MESNLITLNSTKPTFKNTALNEATTKLYDLAAKQASANSAYEQTTAITRKAVAAVLADIEAKKLYKDDGLKSLAEYGATIGLDKSLTHKLENAGRLLNSPDSTIKDFAGKADWSKLAIMASADPKDVAQAIKDGAIKPDSTSAEVKKWKADRDAAKPKTGKVLPKYMVDLTIMDRAGAIDYHYDAIEMEMVSEIDGFTFSSIKDEQGKVTYYGIHADGRMARYTRERVKAQASTPKPVIDLQSLTDEQVQMLIAQYNAKHGKK